MFYVYIYLDIRKKGSYNFGGYQFIYEPFYVGKGKGDRYLTHLKISGKHKKPNDFLTNKIKKIISIGETSS